MCFTKKEILHFLWTSNILYWELIEWNSPKLYINEYYLKYSKGRKRTGSKKKRNFKEEATIDPTNVMFVRRNGGNKQQCPLFGMFTWTLPTLTSKRASLLDWAVMAFVCPRFGKVTPHTLASKSARLVDRDVYFSVVLTRDGHTGQGPGDPREFTVWIDKDTFLLFLFVFVLLVLILTFTYKTYKLFCPLCNIIMVSQTSKILRPYERHYIYRNEFV